MGTKIRFYLKNCHAQYASLHLVSLIPKHFPYDFIPDAQLFLILIIFFSFKFVTFFFLSYSPCLQKGTKENDLLQQKKKKKRSDLEKTKMKGKKKQ